MEDEKAKPLQKKISKSSTFKQTIRDKLRKIRASQEGTGLIGKNENEDEMEGVKIKRKKRKPGIIYPEDKLRHRWEMFIIV